MTTTTFNQIIDGETFTITVPVQRVEKILDRVDRLIESHKFEKAYEVVSPFIGAAKVAKTAAVVKTAPKTNDPMIDVAVAAKALGRYNVIKQLMTQFNVSYQKARYAAIKAGVN